MKRKLAVLLLAALLLTVSMAMFSGCNEKEPREVEIEIINPLTGEVLEQDGVIELPDEETPIEVRVKDKKKDKYLTDKDLEGVTLKECLNISVSRLWKYDYKEALNTRGKFPIEEEGVVTSNYYEIEVKFETKPWDVFEEEYERKYEAKNLVLNFYSDKDWKGTNYFELVSSTIEFLNGEYEDFPDLVDKIDNFENLNLLINNPVYKNNILGAVGDIAKYDEEYFKEKSLLIIIRVESSREKYDVDKMHVKDKVLTVSLIKPQSNYPVLPVVSIGAYIIEIDKEVVGETETIKVENVRR